MHWPADGSWMVAIEMTVWLVVELQPLTSGEIWGSDPCQERGGLAGVVAHPEKVVECRFSAEFVPHRKHKRRKNLEDSFLSHGGFGVLPNHFQSDG
jgi:hypothetical protein